MIGDRSTEPPPSFPKYKKIHATPLLVTLIETIKLYTNLGEPQVTSSSNFSRMDSNLFIYWVFGGGGESETAASGILLFFHNFHLQAIPTPITIIWGIKSGKKCLCLCNLLLLYYMGGTRVYAYYTKDIYSNRLQYGLHPNEPRKIWGDLSKPQCRWRP